MSKLYLGFDAGTQSVKVSVYDENLKSITSQSLPTILRYPHAGWVEMDLDEFWTLLFAALSAVSMTSKPSATIPKMFAQ